MVEGKASRKAVVLNRTTRAVNRLNGPATPINNLKYAVSAPLDSRAHLPAYNEKSPFLSTRSVSGIPRHIHSIIHTDYLAALRLSLGITQGT